MLITPFTQVSTWRSPEAHDKVGSLNLTKHLAGFEPGTFHFICNALWRHWATLSEFGFLRWFDSY